MEQPPRFVALGEIVKVCCLRKSLYGLKQSPFECLVSSDLTMVLLCLLSMLILLSL